MVVSLTKFEEIYKITYASLIDTMPNRITTGFHLLSIFPDIEDIEDIYL
jgi:hypothetical protein